MTAVQITLTDAEQAAISSLAAKVIAAQPPPVIVPPPPPLPPPPPPPPAALSVSIALAGLVSVFDGSKGRDLGDYVGPGFTQHCLMVRDPVIPLTVFFRSDADGKRDEIVVEWGDALKPQAAPWHLGPYTATITKNGAVVATVNVPQHWWLSRWRWQSAPRGVARTALPPWLTVYGNLATVPPITAAQIVPYAPMGLAGLTAYMPTTGERDEIGVLTERTAEYLATQHDPALQQLLAQAEASGTFPTHIRDYATGAPISYQTYPNATTYSGGAGGNPPLTTLVVPAPANVVPEASHFGSLSYVPAKLTGDPYHVEELQLTLTYLLGDLLQHGYPMVIRHDQTRELAWTLDKLCQVIDITPNITPSWLLPKAYWQKILDANVAYLTANYVNSTGINQATLFAIAPDVTKVGPWQEDYLAAVLGFWCLAGFTALRPTFDWKIKSTIARTNGTSGFPREQVSAYWPSLIGVTDWASFAKVNGLTAAVPGKLNPTTMVDANYVSFARGALALASRLGNTDAKACFDWLDPQVRAQWLTWRWSFAA